MGWEVFGESWKEGKVLQGRIKLFTTSLHSDHILLTPIHAEEMSRQSHALFFST